jgi:glycosyltransferase involved in cell wall biosynthesis
MHSLAKTLIKESHKVHIITRSYPGVPQYNIRDRITIIRVKSSPLPGQQRFLAPGAYKELYALLKSGNYDLIHSHGLDSPLSMAALIASRKLGIPSVVTNHSLVGHTPLSPFLYLAGKLLVKNADAVIAVSSAVEKDSKLMTKKPVYRILNGIDCEENDFKTLLPVDREGKLVIASVARMTKKKGVQHLVRLAPSLLERNENLIFIMIGNGPLTKKLEKKVKKSGLSGNFYFTGEIPRRAVLDYLEQADIFAHPSSDEGFGISILEAISKRVPVVAMNHSGVSDIIEHGVNGYLADNLVDFSSCLQVLIENPALRTEFSQKAAEGLPDYDWNRIYEQTCEVYTSVINGKYQNNSSEQESSSENEYKKVIKTSDQREIIREK